MGAAKSWTRRLLSLLIPISNGLGNGFNLDDGILEH